MPEHYSEFKKVQNTELAYFKTRVSKELVIFVKYTNFVPSGKMKIRLYIPSETKRLCSNLSAVLTIILHN